MRGKAGAIALGLFSLSFGGFLFWTAYDVCPAMVSTWWVYNEGQPTAQEICDKNHADSWWQLTAMTLGAPAIFLFLTNVVFRKPKENKPEYIG